MERSAFECPDISPYQAFLIASRYDAEALQAAMIEVKYCGEVSDAPQFVLEARARGAAQSVLLAEESRTRDTMRELNILVRRMAMMPGQRTLVVVSPGFLTFNSLNNVSEVTERALRSNVIINTLDARGLYTVLPVVMPARPRVKFPGATKMARRCST